MADNQTNFEFGENVVQSSSHATPDEIIIIAKQIWRRVDESKININDDSGNERLLATIQNEFKDFNTSFPIVVRWMVQMRKFSSKAMKKYLLKHASVKLDKREDFLRLQAEYLVLLYKEENVHCDERKAGEYRELIIKILIEEDKLFLETHKQVEKEFEMQKNATDQDRRQRLIDYINKQKLSQ